MNSIRIEINEKGSRRLCEFTMASDWSELNEDALGHLATWIFGTINEMEAKTNFFIAACRNLPREILKAAADHCIRSTDEDDVGQFAELLGLADQFRKYPSITSSLIPEFNSLKGPENSFSNFTWERYGLADSFFALYLQERAEPLLDELLAILYRSTEFDGEPCSEALKVIQDPKQTSEADKQRLLLNYMGMRRHVIDLYEWVWPKQDPSKVSDPEEESDLDPYWSQKITRQLSGPEFGSFDEINNMKPHSVLWIYQEELKKAA